MDTLVSFSIGLLFLFIIITAIFKSFNSLDSKKNIPPQPWKLPLIGHIHHLIGATTHQALRDIALKLGPIVHLQLGQVPTVVISSPILAKEVMKTHDLNFSSRPKLQSAEIFMYNYKNLSFSPYGDYWRQMRKICVLEFLSAKKVQSFESVREQESWKLVESITMQGSKTINLSDKIHALTNTFVSRVMVGSECKDQAMLLELIQELVDLIGGFDIGDLFPSFTLLHLITNKKNKIKIHKKLDVILDNIILDHNEQRLNGRINHDKEDLLDVLLRLKEDGDLEFPINFDNVKAIMLDMFLAGSDTSSVLFEWTLSELIKNPTVMKKVQEELRHAFRGKTKIYESDLQELHYLKLAIKETLRLHPPAPLLLPREGSEICEIGGYHIPAKTRVVINAWMIGRDPNYWDEPEKFRPERFIDSSISMNGTDFEYLPFGAGRRMCPGMNLGLANVELPLAMLLYHFDWKVPNGANEDLDMSENFGTVLKKKTDLLLVPHPYKTDY